MEENKRQERDFSQGSMVRNILSMAVPVTIAQAVQLMYNLVDRVYLGHISEGADQALIGVGLVFPIVSIVSAFTQLYSGGGAPLMSIARGAGDEEQASKLENVSFLLLILTGIALMAIFYIFMKPILYAFGASDATYPTAAAYLQIYLLGTLFVMISVGMNLFINAQGFGTTGMITVCIGAVLNIILDPFFIFVLHMGVRGAAIATVISQFASCLWVLVFLNGKKVQFPLKKSDMKLHDGKMILSIIGLGTSGFIMCVTNSLSQIACNATLARWGGDLYVGAMTILNSVREIFNLAANGITEGAKPVLGFNFGAGEYDRVKKGIKVTCTMVYDRGVVAGTFLPGILCGTVYIGEGIGRSCGAGTEIILCGILHDGIHVLWTVNICGTWIPETGDLFQFTQKSSDRSAADGYTAIFYGGKWSVYCGADQ